MGKTIFFSVPASGHVNPTISVIKELCARGEDVLCVNVSTWRSTMEATGAHFTAYPDADFAPLVKEFQGDQDLLNLAITLAFAGEQVMRWCIDLINIERPNYIIFDSLAHWGKQSRPP